MRATPPSPLRYLLPAVLLAAAANAETVRLAREPAPAPDGRSIAFSWRGDIFVGSATGGPARRLTSHPADDRKPAWSPDGSLIAFTSDRHGNRDVFVMGSDGSALARLTHHSDADTQPAFDADGQHVVFSSRRQRAYSYEAPAWRVPVDGSRDPEAWTRFGARGVSPSPDGTRAVLVRGRSPWWRKDERSSTTHDLWLWTVGTGAAERLTRHRGNDDSASWLRTRGREEIVYRTDLDGTFNVWSLDPATGRREQLTHFEGDGVTSPRAGGGLVAFEVLDRLWLLERATGRVRELSFEAPADSAVSRRESKTYSKDASDLAISPDGEEMAFVVRGEVLAALAEKEPADDTAARITQSSTRDRQPAWLPDGESIVFASDAEGSYDLYRARPRDEPADDEPHFAGGLAFTVERLTDSPEDDLSPQVSPDGRHVAFRRGRGDLVVLDLKRSRERVLSPGWNLGDVRWSPDGKWLAFSRSDDEFNEEIWLLELDGDGTLLNVSQHPDYDEAPRWSSNGRALAFSAVRSGSEERVALLFLREEDAALAKHELEKAWKAAADPKKDDSDEDEDQDDGEEDDAPALPKVVVDADRIHERVRLLAAMPGATDLALSPDGLSVAYGARGLDGKVDLWKVSWDGAKNERLTTGGARPSSIAFSEDGKSITFLGEGGKIRRVDAKGGSPDTFPFRARLEVDHAGERRQVFDEAWRLLDDNFYDAAFHGADWSALRTKYGALAELASTRAEFQDVVRRMLGELNASHLGIGGGGDSDASREVTGELGGDLAPAGRRDSGWEIRHVVQDGPLDDAGLERGDVVVAIDDVELGPGSRLSALLRDRAGERVRLTVRDDGRGREREVVVRPITPGALRNLLYDEWVRERKRLTDEQSGDRIGYLHVRAMSVSSLERFEQQLFSVGHGKDALIVDVRNNGGGWTTDMMLAMLMVKPHAVTVPRGGGRGYPQGRRPLYSWSKPIATLCNQHSYSNAEIFSHAVKTLGRGTVLGVETGGAVISTGGQRLLDGSWLRLPFRGWWVAEPSGDPAAPALGVNMERVGAIPDIVVEQHPSDEASGEDPQLRAAVRHLLAQLEAR